MKKCKACQKEVDPKATKCPHCQTDLRNWFQKHPILTALIIFFAIGFISSNADKNKESFKNTKVTEIKKEKEINPTPTPIIIEAKKLIEEYDTNKLLAEDKYTDKTIQTTAYISNISSDIVGQYFLSLKPTNDQYYFGTDIKCSFEKKDSLLSLKKEQQVTVVGKMDKMSLGIIIMKDCKIVD
jgi:hypothetical protein